MRTTSVTTNTSRRKYYVAFAWIGSTMFQCSTNRFFDGYNQSSSIRRVYQDGEYADELCIQACSYVPGKQIHVLQLKKWRDRGAWKYDQGSI